MPHFRNDPVLSVDNAVGAPAVKGESSHGEGVRGVSQSTHAGVVGINDWVLSIPRHEVGEAELVGTVDGTVDPVTSDGAVGVFGLSEHGNGGWFESRQGEGVRGWSKNASHGGVVGVNTGGGMGVYGDSASGVGIWGSSANREGVHAETKSSATAALVAHQLNAASDTAALYAKHASPQGLAAVLEGKVLVQGNVLVTGDIQLANAADCAEEFDIAAETCVEPGTVMVLNDDGTLQASSQPHDTRVVGVISGAGRYRPGLVLDKQESLAVRQPIALMGKVFCKADAHFGAISVGDLLTSSPTPGHAMKTNDPRQAFGAVIGKALRPLAGGRGLIPILIALQ